MQDDWFHLFYCKRCDQNGFARGARAGDMAAGDDDDIRCSWSAGGDEQYDPELHTTGKQERELGVCWWSFRAWIL